MEDESESSEIEKAIFGVALSIDDPDTRDRFLKRSFAGDLAGLSKMTGLLESSKAAASFFLNAKDARGSLASDLLDEPGATEKTVPPQPASVNRTGTTIGPYLIGRCLGAGGSGTVYEAVQRVPVHRTVALKIVRMNTSSASAKARFDIERQAVAIMDHPNIAKILDAGGISDGTAYFVMELIEGQPITEYCDQNKIPIQARIRLFIDVCLALQHAHSKRIIHRDIKPSNVLVTIKDQKPTPKVIDFGIAKALAADSPNMDSYTGHDEFFGTPAYMSPEQVAMVGIDVDTRSDIYSLGVLLYELLTSHTPFDKETLGSRGIAAMRSTLQNRSHPKPSVKLSELMDKDARMIADARSTDPAKLTAAVKGDLDWIIMKALSKDRNERYETANGLGMDLRRFLENKPVTARRPSNYYLLRKFVQRNKIPVAFVSALSFSVLLGVAVSATLFIRERAALFEQKRLSREAEAAKLAENRVRTHAEARANVSRAAILWSEGQIDAADKLIQVSPLESVEPSKEAAVFFRTLARWYAKFGRWEESARCFELMSQANKMSSASEILRGVDLVTMAPALIESGRLEDYERFRNTNTRLYMPVVNATEGEHLLKACLLRPASAAFLVKLKQAADIVEAEMKNKHPSSTNQSWNALSLCLYHYRGGNHDKAIEVGTFGVNDPKAKDACIASIFVVLSMAHKEKGEIDLADTYYARAGAIYDQSSTKIKNNEIYPDHFPDRWYDWANLLVLLDETE